MKYIIMLILFGFLISCVDNEIEEIVIKDRDVGKDSINSNISVYGIIDIAKIEQNIYFGNVSSNTISKINKKGLINTYGRSGKGPNEFSSKINSLFVYNDNLFVLEYGGIVHVLDSNLVLLKMINLFENNRQSISPNPFQLNSIIVEDNKIICGTMVNLINNSNQCDVGYVFDLSGILLKKLSVDKKIINSISKLDISSITKLNDAYVVSFKIKNILLAYSENGTLKKISEKITFPGYVEPEKVNENYVRFVSVSNRSFQGFENYLLHIPVKKNRAGYIITEVYNADFEKISSISLFKPIDLENYQLLSIIDDKDLLIWDFSDGLSGLFRIHLKNYLDI